MNRKLLRACGVCAVALVLAACNRDSGEALLASGKALLEKKDLRGAVIQLKNTLQKNPNSAEARFLLGKALLEGGDPVAALLELRKAQELQTPDEQVIPELARAMLLVGEESKLIGQYADVQLKTPLAAAELKTSLAAAYAMQRDTDKARATAEQALRTLPGHAPALIVLARLRAIDNDTDGAIALLDDVLGADAGNERAGVLKAELLLQGKQDVDAALAAFRKVLQAHPNSVIARAATANILFQQKKTDEAKAEFALLKKAAPNHPETLYFEAQLAFAEKDYKRTREVSDLILKVMPNNVRVLELAGAAEYRMKGYLQAEALLGRAIKLAPKQLMTRLLLAQTYLRSGQPNKVIDALQPILEGGKPDATSLSLAGEAYLQLGDSKRLPARAEAGAAGQPGAHDGRAGADGAWQQLGRRSRAHRHCQWRQRTARRSGAGQCPPAPGRPGRGPEGHRRPGKETARPAPALAPARPGVGLEERPARCGEELRSSPGQGPGLLSCGGGAGGHRPGRRQAGGSPQALRGALESATE